jgi:hypothetical protein
MYQSKPLETILCFWQIVSGNPSHFVFNMDEMDYQESADGLRKLHSSMAQRQEREYVISDRR